MSQHQLPVPVLRPSVRVLSGPSSPTSSSAATISFATAAATSVTCSLDGGAPAICSSPVSYGALTVGQHSLTVTASSRTGSSTATYRWTITAPSTPLPLGVSGTWKLKFDDEFSGSSLDLSKWEPNWLAGNDTSITPPDNSNDLNCMDPAQVSEGGGVLTLSAVARQCRAANSVTYQYASGLINTYKSFNFSYGYLEARIYLPSSNGAFVNFPAFWADGRGTWPATGELDVMEVLGSCVGFHFHSSLGGFGGCPAQGLTPGWHTFGANWQPGSVTYYYDGQRVGQVTSGITGYPMYLILNNSVDPTWGGPTMTPAAMQIDYVRVWQ